MSVSFAYDQDQRMIFSGIECNCGCKHAAIDRDIYVGKDLLRRIPDYIARKQMGKECLLVADDNTYKIAGQQVESALSEAGYRVSSCVIHRDGEMLPDDSACGEVLLSITQSTEFLIAVGSGSVTDITRINAARTGLPFVSVGTAPSMDGYTSAVAPLLHRGVKIQRPAVCPQIIVCDLDILSTAPLKMVASGVGDVLGKYIAKADWQISHLITGEACCPVCMELVTKALDALVNNAEEIAKKSEKGMRLLIEALLLAGITIMIIDNTRAVASIEHNIAQYWEMMLVQKGIRPPMHGASVGVATLLVWPFYEQFAREDLSTVDADRMCRNLMTEEDRVRWMHAAYGIEGGDQIMKSNPEDFLTEDVLRSRITAAKEHFPEIQKVIQEMPPMEKIVKVMQTLHADLTPADENIPADLLNWSMWCGKDYRTRYTLLKTLDECGLLSRYLSEWPCPEY